MPTQPKDNKPCAKLVEISADNAGQRIDNFLLSQLKGVPRSHVYQLLRSGQVRVNSGRKQPSYRLIEGDSVRLPPVKVSDEKKIHLPASMIKALLDAKLYEDDDLLIINKPAGIPVHSGSGFDFGVIEILRKPYENQFLELAHRIDLETSGCLLLAKNRQTLLQVNKLFSEDKTAALQKHYQTLVAGHWPSHTKIIDAPIQKTTRGGEHIMEINPQGSHAVSHFSCEQQFQIASLMNVKIETGRTHQIRVHAAHAGHPVAGDTKYGLADFNKAMKRSGLSRLFLHARRIELDLAKTICVEAPLSSDLESVLEKLKQSY